jgi:uncharacterized RDD family membrane protein YckC
MTEPIQQPGTGGPQGAGPPGYGQPYPQQPPVYGASYQGNYPAYPGYPAQPVYQGSQYRQAGDPTLAEWWQRLLARLVDGIVLVMLLSPLYVIIFVRFFHKIQALIPANGGPVPPQRVLHIEGQYLGSFLLVAVAAAVIAFVYDWLQHGLWGQTLGKRALGIVVVTADGRRKVSGGQAAGRAAVYALPPGIPFVGGLFGLLNELWLLWDPRRQCLHDKAAHTVVIKKNQAGV